MPDHDFFQPDRQSYLRFLEGSHSAYRLHYHLVFRTKYRASLLTDSVAKRFLGILDVQIRQAGFRVLAASIQHDHVHLLLSLKPSDAPSKIVGLIKGATSRILRREMPHLRIRARDGSLWADGYWISTVGDASVAQIKAYLNRQDQHHGPVRTGNRPKGRR